MSQVIAEILRKLEQIFIIGTIAELDGASARVTAGDLTTQFLPFLNRAGDDLSFDGYDVGEQVLVFSPGDPSQGVIVGALNSDENPPPTTDPNKHHRTYKDGAVIEYDREAKHLKAILPAGATTELVSDGGISITGDTSITGNLTVSGNEDVGGNQSIGGDSDISGNNTVGGVTSTAGFACAGSAGGTAEFSGDLIIKGISYSGHTHNETGDGGGTTGVPQ